MTDLINLTSDTLSMMVSVFVILTFLSLERFFHRKAKVKLTDAQVDLVGSQGQFLKVSFSYLANTQQIPFSLVSGRLVDKAAPTTVIECNPRSLGLLSKERYKNQSVHSEFLLFPADEVAQSGDESWVLSIQVITIGNTLNPFHKIFPMHTRLVKEVVIPAKTLKGKCNAHCKK
ncbi:hypothetical protein KO527_05490 [Pseudoalteromonas sp. C2R02]|uniref:hypothetical protein n=1 Tax=Pseudoalteromonas sp. C2R02 TaxID=2841565 RepID=UPI001C0A588D|nr:hypothetical protein [Pseudoalteromonas sp. C2R02]MBU2968802.1 hypothetical protein [Pseudoalteromonas sp. C2R02]